MFAIALTFVLPLEFRQKNTEIVHFFFIKMNQKFWRELKKIRSQQSLGNNVKIIIPTFSDVSSTFGK